MVKSAADGETDFPVPTSILGASRRLLSSYEDVVRRTSDFAIEVADVVRDKPESVAGLIHQLAISTSWVFQRWNLEILYLLSLQREMRYSHIQDAIQGISGRSLSLKLDEMEAGGLVHRQVSDDKPPHVLYSLTERGRTLTRLSFPMVLHLNMDGRLRQQLGGATASAIDPRGSAD